MTAQEWQTIEAGVAQRARLLNAVLVDLYGKQELLSTGALPPEIPFGHPNFFGPAAASVRATIDGCRSTPPTSRARPTAAGGCSPTAPRRPRVPAMRWKIGRSCGARFPHLAQSMDVRPLGAFFAALREELLRGAGEEPLAVVLTPGSFNETYFEHAYLARQLGFPLVEGHDLTVRDESVFLKTLAGPEARACDFAQARR